MAKVRKGITFEVTHRFLSELFGEDVHAKRVSSLANANQLFPRRLIRRFASHPILESETESAGGTASCIKD